MLADLHGAAWAVKNQMESGLTAAAQVWEWTGAGGTAEVLVTPKANGCISGLGPGMVCAEALGLAVVGAEADKTVWLSKARECDSPEFWVNLVPADTGVVTGPATELLFVGKEC